MTFPLKWMVCCIRLFTNSYVETRSELQTNKFETVQNICLNKTKESETLKIKFNIQQYIQYKLDCEILVVIILKYVFNIVSDKNTISLRKTPMLNNSEKGHNVFSNSFNTDMWKRCKISGHLEKNHLHLLKPEQSKKTNSSSSRTVKLYSIQINELNFIVSNRGEVTNKDII